MRPPAAAVFLALAATALGAGCKPAGTGDATDAGAPPALASPPASITAALAADAGPTPAQGPRPLSPVPILPGKGTGTVAIGATLNAVEKALGPCTRRLDAEPARVCLYFEHGVEVGLRDGKVLRVALYREGRTALDGNLEKGRFRGFVGETPEGVHVGMSKADVEARLGKGYKRFHPVGDPVNDDGTMVIEVLEYASRGLSLDIDLGRDGLVVGRIHIPRGAVGKPW